MQRPNAQEERHKHQSGQYIYNPPGERVETDTRLTQQEDAIIKAINGPKAVDLSRLSLQELKDNQKIGPSPVRPSYGTNGFTVMLRTNYFHLPVDRTLQVHRYSIHVRSARPPKPQPGKRPARSALDQGDDTSGEVQGKQRKRAVQLFIAHAALAEVRRGIATDFKGILVSRVKLAQEQKNLSFPYYDEDEAGPSDASQRWSVSLEDMGPMDLSQDDGESDPPVSFSSLVDYLNSSDGRAPPIFREQLKALLNIILNYKPSDAISEDVMSLGQRHFKVTDGAFNGMKTHDHSLAGLGLDIKRGYFASVRFAASRIILNVQVRNTVTKEAGPLKNLVKHYGRDDLPKLERFLSKLRITTTHLQGNSQRIRTIKCLAHRNDTNETDRSHNPDVTRDFAGPQQVKFWMTSNGQTQNAITGLPRYVSVAELFKKGALQSFLESNLQWLY